jgi:hypothetical protein
MSKNQNILKRLFSRYKLLILIEKESKKHISGWTVNEFKQLNFSVYGLNGWKYLWKLENGRSVLRFKPKLLCKLISCPHRNICV